MNIIKINGIKGIATLIMAGSCLFAGFVVFPGWVAMNIWNYLASLTLTVPSIGLVQGVLLWGIMIALYFITRKERLVICVKSPQGLSEEELKTVFAEMKKRAQDDTVIQAMMKARETELKLKEPEENKTETKELH